MADCMKAASEQLHQLLLDGLGRMVAEEKVPAVPVPSFRVEIPADKSHGDFAANVAMVSAKAFRMAPRKIAELLLESISLNGTIFDRAEIAGPGFLNFFLKQQWFADVAETVLREKEQYGKTQTGAGKRALVEFVSANPTGPMHVGNARGGALGDSLAEILSWTGWDVQREFYVNDAGNQIEKFATSLEVRYLQHFDPSVEMPEDAYHGADIIEHAENFIAAYGDQFVQADAKARRNALVEFALPKNIAGLERDLKKYRIVYDNWFRESTLHQNGQVKWVVDELTKRGYTFEQEGAVWFKA